MKPWIPPMMLVSIEGHAIFQTAAGSGPSTIDRSYRPIRAAGDSGTAGPVVSTVTGAETPVIGCASPSRARAHLRRGALLQTLRYTSRTRRESVQHLQVRAAR